MNKADNEAGNAAIDSLLNYETVKVRSNPLLTCTHQPYNSSFSSSLSPPLLPSSILSFYLVFLVCLFFFYSLKPRALT